MKTMTDLDKIRAQRKTARRAVLKEILDAGPEGTRIVGCEATGFAIDLLELGFVSCNDEGDRWTIRTPQAARLELDAPPEVVITPHVSHRA